MFEKTIKCPTCGKLVETPPCGRCESDLTSLFALKQHAQFLTQEALFSLRSSEDASFATEKLVTAWKLYHDPFLEKLGCLSAFHQCSIRD